MKKTVRTMTLDGGCICLNFVNTVYSRIYKNTYDYLNTYDDVLVWSERVKILQSARLNELRISSTKDVKHSEEILKVIIKKRELLHTVFTSFIHGEDMDELSYTIFNNTLSESLSKVQLQINGRKVETGWNESRLDLLEPLWVIYKDAFDVLTSNSVNRIKECKLCGWLFLDNSKNSSRSWCSMKSCGSLEKSKRYYHKVKNTKIKQNNG